ncbi:uncharacterized protein LOC107263232 isoform X1 [Cephus cinctus]|uniref:Uncharacterized protein LOC107263232 isoform X1 n=1 Tax=Cephus cinctus TaxID=211228 RepID=A0AAJ7BGS1_CEPCN|nr:uncharacterized protein LOC107263232 isoform X1 [Cephus cinctus]
MGRSEWQRSYVPRGIFITCCSVVNRHWICIPRRIDQPRRSMKKFAVLIESAVTFWNPFIVEDRCYAEVAACIMRQTHHEFNDRTDSTKRDIKELEEDAGLEIETEAVEKNEIEKKSGKERKKIQLLKKYLFGPVWMLYRGSSRMH